MQHLQNCQKMSVSDPLLKKLKAFIIALRSKNETVQDSHHLLSPLCETLENILLKGLKSSSSWFGAAKTEYWLWISKISTAASQMSVCPLLLMTVNAVKDCKKTKHDRGRGRLFVRNALVKNALVPLVKLLKQNETFTLTHYFVGGSVLGNEILLEILLSLLLELQAISFSLQLKNASFLDICWELPVYKQYELVPSAELGLDIRTVRGYPLVTQVDPNSVAGEDNKICVGDVLDEMCGQSLRGVGKSGVYFIFNQHEGQPVTVNIMKGLNKDGTVYGPICRLRQMTGDAVDMSPASPVSPSGSSPFIEYEERTPPEAILPEDIDDEVPVHDSEAKATYTAQYLGKAYLGKDGRVNMIEQGVTEVLGRSRMKQTVTLELGEKDIVVTNLQSKELVFQHLFTEVSACGRRTDALKNFAFIAGETYCSFAKEFYCHVFEASTEDEAKVILCTIAQGFERTHLMT